MDGAPGSTSLSSTVTGSVGSLRLSYSLAPVTAWVSVALSSTVSVSSEARTVTVCAVLQFIVVKVRVF